MSKPRPFAFRFWEPPQSGTPAYIDLCLETHKAALSDAFELVLLNWDTCIDWIPNRDKLWALSSPRRPGNTADQTARRWALFTDLLRIELVAHHGGLWIDADTLALPPMCSLADAVQSADLVTSLGPGHRLMNGVFGARPDSAIMRDYIMPAFNDLIASKTDSGDKTAVWGEFGGALITSCAAQASPSSQIVLPFGQLIQNDDHTYFDVFDQSTNWNRFIAPGTMAISLYNNSIPAEFRAATAKELLANDTPLSRAYAMSKNASDPMPLSSPWALNQAQAVLPLLADRVKLSTKLKQLKTSRIALKTKLDARGNRVKELKAENQNLKSNLRSKIGGTEDQPQSRASVFKDIFDNGLWLAAGSHSGCGSSLKQTESLRTALPSFLKRHGIKSLLDIPCGDFNWMQHLDLGIPYIGADIVPAIIEANQAFENDTHRFCVADLVSDELPHADCVMVRDCLSHLTLADALIALSNIKRSGARFLLVTHFREEAINAEITTGDFHRLNLCKAPFNLPEPIDLIDEAHPNPKHADKSLALWATVDLPD